MRSKPGKETSTTLKALVLVILLWSTTAMAQTSSFTYQGKLTDGGTAANGGYDLQFALWDSLTGGTQIGSTATLNGVAVSNGVFSVTLDFGASSFSGPNRFLEISARPSGSGSFTLLSPRQPVTATPYAVRSTNAASADALSNACAGCVLDSQINSISGSKVSGTVANATSATSATNATNATTATNATQLGGVAASQYAQTNDSRLTDSRNPLPGSSNYIQNTNNAQANTNFNISGNGSVGGTLSGNVVNGVTQFNLAGGRVVSVSGSQSQPNSDLFVGIGAGQASDSSAGANTFVGQKAGQDNTSGGANSYFGNGAGAGNTTGIGNTFVGVLAGTTSSNPVISNFNTFIGVAARIGDFGLTRPSITNATAIGADAHVDQSNSIVLGSISGSEGTADVNVGIGTRIPSNRLDVNVGFSSLQDPGITIQGQTSFSGDIGLRINNTNGGKEWYIDSAGTGSAYGAGNLVFAIRGTTPAALIVHPSGSIELTHLGTAGGSSLCLNGQNVIAACSSSLRYKTNVKSFRGGLDILNRLRPISFEWKQNHVRDIGLGAEEVEKVEPLLTFRNDKGEIEGVKYNQLSAVFINAIKEQQAQIESLQKANAALNERLRTVEESLRKKRGLKRHR